MAGVELMQFEVIRGIAASLITLAIVLVRGNQQTLVIAGLGPQVEREA